MSVKENGGRFEVGTYRLNAASVNTVSQGVFEPGEISVAASVAITYTIE